MMKTGRLAAVLAVAVLAAGCLRKETTHTLYLSPDGSVRWVVNESGVYSDEEDPGKRIAEEQAYIGAALIGTHPMAQALQWIKPDSLVRTTVIRDERPYHVITDARFASADRMFERLFAENGMMTTASLSEAGGRSALRMRFDFTREPEERDSPASVLLEDLEEFRLVLTEGRFIAGGGFDVQNRTTARFSKEWMENAGKALEAKATIELVLAWEAGS